MSAHDRQPGIAERADAQCDEAHAMEAPYSLGREYSVAEALTILRRATFDPGQFTKRVPYHEGEHETLERWQARACLVALSAAGVPLEAKWSGVGFFTEYERAEIGEVLS